MRYIKLPGWQEMRAKLYPCNDGSVPCNACAMPPTKGNQPVVQFTKNTITFSLRVRIDVNMLGGDMTIPTWAMHLLDIEPGSDCEYQWVQPSCVAPTSVTLQFKLCRRVWAWSDVPVSNSNVTGANSWNIDWPAQLSVSALQVMLPLLMLGFAVSGGGFVAVQALDHTLVRLQL